MSARLVAVFAVASVTGLVFGGLRVSDAVRDSNAYARTAQLAVLGEQATALAQALENERDLYAGVAAYGALRSAAIAGKAMPTVLSQVQAAQQSETRQLAVAERITDASARRTMSLTAAIGPAFPANTQAKAENVVAMINGIPGLRSELLAQSAAQVIASYSNSIADLFALDDEITSGSGDAALADETRALGALSRAKDQASQQRGALYATLIEVSVDDAGTGKSAPGNPSGAPYNGVGLQSLVDSGGLGALSTAQGLEFADLTDFDDAATPAQSNTYLTTVAGQQDNDAQLIEGFVMHTGDPRLTFEPVGAQTSLGFNQATVAATWYSDCTAVIDQMRSVESQVATAVVARSQMLEHGAFDSAVITAAVTGAAVLLVLLVTALVGRSLVNPLRRLQADALEIAAVRLPARVAAAAAGADTDTGPGMVEPIGVRSTDEIGRVARAFDQVHAEAVRLAGNEAQLRGSLSAMFISLSRRSVPLIERLARMIDAMEQHEDDPDQLANLFAMDHLVTRMRRNSENLLVLAGEEPVRKWTEPVPLTDVARAAASEIEQYSRVTLAVQPGIMVSGQAAADVVHLLAELIENATLFSPRDTQVRVTVTELGTGGVMVEVRDDGVGVSPNRLAGMNWRLDHPPTVDVNVSRHMGLYAVSRLAARHGIRVRLRPATPQGLSALVWLPGPLTRREQIPAGGFHSRPPDADGTDAVPGLRTLKPAKRGSGRHRGGLLSTTAGQPLLTTTAGQPLLTTTGGQPLLTTTGEQPLLSTTGEQPLLTSTGEQPLLTTTGEQPLLTRSNVPSGPPATPWPGTTKTQTAPPGSGPTAPAWFAAKRPSTGAAASPEELTASWERSAGGLAGTWPRDAGDASALARRPAAEREPTTDGTNEAQEQAERTASGLPRRLPRSSAYPGPDIPAATQEAATQEVNALGAPAQEAPAREASPQERPEPEQVPSRRSPEAIRSRLSGFQLGSRDATQAVQRPAGTPSAGEENGR